MVELKVALIVDLTIYDRRLKPGVLGVTREPFTHRGKLNKAYTGVKFNIGPHLDVRWDQLEII